MPDNTTEYQLWLDIQDIVGPANLWPRQIRQNFWANHWSHCERLKTAAFIWINGLNLEVYYDWCDLRQKLIRGSGNKDTFNNSSVISNKGASHATIDYGHGLYLWGGSNGSVLGPLLFVLFISPVANVINPDLSETSNLVSFHQYADDTQLYIGTNASTLVHQVALIESCTQRVHNWLLNNGLHLNPSKSEAIAFFNPRSKPLEALAESIKSISVAGSPIKLQSSIKNLGVYLDSKMSFDKQVSETCKASYFHIRTLRHIWSSLTTEACKTVAAAIVGLRLDYCNSLLAGTSVSNLACLQLARVIAQKSRFCHITPILADLHWLFVRHRINFKIATIAFKVLHFQQPTYLAALVPRYVPMRSLRSFSSLSICIPSRKTAMARSKTFSSVASDTWNKLPCHLSSISALLAFRKKLEHHLFSSAFPGISSPSTDITLCDVITSTNVNHTRCTLLPS